LEITSISLKTVTAVKAIIGDVAETAAVAHGVNVLPGSAEVLFTHHPRYTPIHITAMPKPMILV
jgi:hypothetical protein